MTVTHADSIFIGVCTNPECHNVHIQLCSGDNNAVFGQYTVFSEDVDEIVRYLRDAQIKARKGH